MKSQSSPGLARAHRILSTTVFLVALIACGVFMSTVWDVTQDKALTMPVLEEGSPDAVDREWISDEEYARRAAASPDQVPVGKRFVRFSETGRKSGPGGLTWESIGPTPFVDEYWSGNDMSSGRVSALLVDPNDPSIVYVAGAQGGVWKTVDGGVAWVPLTDHLSSLASGALAFDPHDSDIIWYGTGEQHYSGDSFYGDGLFRSDDAGASWTKVALKADVGSYISRIVVDAGDTDLIYLSSDRGFVRSADGGVTWTVTLGTAHCTDILADPGVPGVLYCAMRSSGVWKSTDSGVNWTLLTNGMPTSGFRRINMAMAATNSSVIYAAFASEGGDLYGMYKTTNGGASWTSLPAPNYFGHQGNYDNCITVDPRDEDVCYAGGNFPFGGPDDYGLIKTTDGGASWVDVNVGIDGSQPHPDHHIFAWGDDGRLWVGNDGGVWYTLDGGLHWVNCNATLSFAQFYTNAIHPTDPNFILGGTQDNGAVRHDGTDQWPQVSAGDGGPCLVEWDSPNIYFTTYVRLYYLFRYDNGVYDGDVAGPWWGERASWCNSPLVADPNRPNTILTGTHRVWQSLDSGDSWNAISDDLTAGEGYLLALDVARDQMDTYYSGSSDGLVHVKTGLTNWTPRSNGLPAAPITDIAVDPADWQTAYLSVDDQSSTDYVYVTDDAGVTWTGINGDMPNGLRALCLAVDFRTTPHRLYVGTDYGIYVSCDTGATWIKADANVPSMAIYDMKVDPVNSLLIAATHGRGMWRTALDVTGPVLALTSPDGGEILSVGHDHDITWTASDDNDVTVSLLLSRDGGMSYPEDIATDIANTGSFTWTVAGPPSTTCRVRVVAEDAATNTTTVASAGDFTIQDDLADAPASPYVTALHAAHPNPFNPRTTISFELGRGTQARVDVYAVDGQLIRTLVNGVLPAGPHSAVWDGTDARGRPVASGNYLYALTTGDGFRRSGKMLLMK